MVKLKMLDGRPVGRAPAVGEAWEERAYLDEQLYRARFNAAYKAGSSKDKRAPIVVRLPDGSDCVLDFEEGLKVTGEGDALTVEGTIRRGSREYVIRDGEIRTAGEATRDAEKAQEEQPAQPEAAPADAPVQAEPPAKR